MIWSDKSIMTLIFQIIYCQWICETQKTKDVETETFRESRNSLVQELNNNRKNDFIMETVLVVNLLFNIYLGVKLKLVMKKLKF